MDPLAWITLALFVIGTVYYAGSMAARLSRVEDEVREIKGDVKSIRTTTDAIATRRHVAVGPSGMGVS